MTADIFLKRHGIEAITTNQESLAVTTGKGKDPDIELSPNSAGLVLGGGDGDYSDGDIRLMDRPDGSGSEPRIHLTGGTGSTDSGTRIRMDGSDGTARLGAESADDPDIELLPGTADVALGGGSGGDDVSDGGVKLFDGDGRQRVFVESGGSAPRQGTRTENAVYLTGGGPGVPRPDGSEDDAGQLVLKQIGDDYADAPITLDGGTAQLTLGSDVESGDLKMYRQDLLRTIALAADDATVRVGNYVNQNGEAGTVVLADDTGTDTITLESATGSGDGGAISIAHDSGASTVDADGGAGSLTLGNGAAGQSGVPGSITLVDAGGKTTGLLESQRAGDGAGLALNSTDGATTVDASAGDGALTLGNGAAGQSGVPGSITLVDAGGKTTGSLESERSNGGAGLALSSTDGDTTADIAAGTATMELGGHGTAGTLLLTDSNGNTFELTVQDGTIRLGSGENGKVAMELDTDDGEFKVVDGDGDAAFKINTQRKTIKKGKKYTGGVVGHGS